jgi:hypothetical protein
MRGDGEKGYPRLFLHTTGSWALSMVTTLLLLSIVGVFYFWYSHYGSDPTPDSIVGLSFAIAGTIFLVLAGISYSLRRRSRRRAIGKLHAALNWHICFALLALALLFIHSFGNFNPRTGTYALFGMIALVISGIVGRTLDHIIPRMIAQEVRKALTAQGEDRIETISQKLQSIIDHNSQELRGFSATNKSLSFVGEQALSKKSIRAEVRDMINKLSATEQPLHTSWDLAYISLEETPQEINQDAPRFRFVPDKQSALSRPEALIPGAQAHIEALKSVQRALQREQFYRYIIRYWRIFHIGLALLTVALTLWHIEYALQLLLPTLLHR